MAHKQGPQLGFNAVGAGKTMVLGEDAYDNVARPGMSESASGTVGGGVEHGSTMPGGSEKVTDASGTAESYARPGGSQQLHKHK